MILTCDSCSTQFSLDATLLGATGKRVKCSRCGHSWFQKQEDASVKEETPPAAAIPVNEQKLDEPRPRSKPPLVVAKPPKQAGQTLKLATVAMWMIGISMQAVLTLHYLKLGGTLLAGMGLSDTSAYQFTPVAVESIPADAGKFTIAVEGGVKNISAKEVLPQPVTITLYDAHSRKINEGAYVFKDVPSIGSGSTVPFQPRITNIPASVARVTLDLGNSLERSLR